jgi:hypothetical protein
VGARHRVRYESTKPLLSRRVTAVDHQLMEMVSK